MTVWTSESYRSRTVLSRFAHAQLMDMVWMPRGDWAYSTADQWDLCCKSELKQWEERVQRESWLQGLCFYFHDLKMNLVSTHKFSSAVMLHMVELLCNCIFFFYETISTDKNLNTKSQNSQSVVVFSIYIKMCHMCVINRFNGVLVLFAVFLSGLNASR